MQPAYPEPAAPGLVSRPIRLEFTKLFPRSRGVYPSWVFSTSVMKGSSPLARGLRRGGSPRAAPHRIIPARAGFTAPGARCSPPAADHPRSRGVYALAAEFASATSGSSPLARGLQEAPTTGTPSARIIPARAGFTCFSSVVICQARDHPRSRGVYTAWTSLARSMTPDHPRSRGVYWTSCHRFSDQKGSSPLARGLLLGGRLATIHARIIPARAGFTADGRTPRLPGRDHPRSRGVYNLNAGNVILLQGSSPLARGLRRHRLRGPRRVRIIPARAGFTSPRSTRSARCGDHPRSRGVYSARTLAGLTSLGSSPLARGLP